MATIPGFVGHTCVRQSRNSAAVAGKQPQGTRGKWVWLELLGPSNSNGGRPAQPKLRTNNTRFFVEVCLMGLRGHIRVTS